MRRPIARVVVALIASLLLIAPLPADAAPEGTMTWGVHITLASRWLDPAETEGIITPFMVPYALHHALVKPMPAGLNTPSLAESWTQPQDGLTDEFVIRKGVRFHNNDPITGADVKFSFEHYKGAGSRLLKGARPRGYRSSIPDACALCSRRKRFTAAGRGRRSTTSSSRRSNGWRGTTAAVCSNHSATFRRQSSSRPITVTRPLQPSW